MQDARPEAVLSDEERELLARSGAPAPAPPDDEFPPPPPGYHLAAEPARRTNYSRLVFVLCSIVLACTAVAALIGERTPRTCTKMRTPECFGDAVLSSMDRSADPCSNFYEYACGSWLRKKRIPEDKSGYSRSFTRVAEDIKVKLRNMLDKDLQNSAHPNAIAGRFYSACLRDYAKGPQDLSVLRPFRPVFNSLVSAETFAVTLATLHAALSSALFSIGVGVDEKHPERYAISLGQSGLGLSHPNDYTSKTESLMKIRAAYLVLIEGHLRASAKAKLIPYTDFTQMAKKMFEFEKGVAFIHKLPEELRDPTKLYNPMQFSQFPQEMFIDKYFKAIGVDKTKVNSTIIVEDPTYLKEVANMMARVKNNRKYRDTVKAYLAFHLVRHFAANGMMGEELYNDEFDFRTVRTGVKKLAPRWKRCQSLTASYVGDQLGQAFVSKHFPKKSKEAADRLTSEIIRSFHGTLRSEDWMDDATKKKALEKLDAIDRKIGYTSKFDTYPGLVVTKRTFGDNMLNAMKYAKNYELNRLGKPVDKTEWFMNAFTVNAYYAPPRNEIVFPAGILQQPFFSDLYPDAMNYGGIGMVIGHEMSHGFDDSGRKYDAMGRLTSWWSEAAARAYKEKTKCFVDLFNGYKPRSVDVYVKGNLTLGENLADTGGVKVAFQAFKNAGNNSDPNARAPNPVLAEELTNHQLFFVAYAQTWCVKTRPKALREQLLTDPHSPGQFRVRGPLSQTPEFAAAFNCKLGTNYNPVKKCKLWR